MSAYHSAAFTLDPTVEIPDEAPPAIGVELAGTEGEIKTLSDAQLAVTIDVAVVGPEATFTITPDEAPVAPYTMHWDFGNGRRETAHDLEQRCIYAPGVYDVRVTVERPGRTSVDLTTTVVV